MTLGPDVQGLIRSVDCKMSSMWRVAAILPVLLAIAPSSSAQYAAPAMSPAYAAVPAPSVAYSLNDWRTLRQSSNYSFADYARFLIANPGWPDERQDAALGGKGDAAGRECGDRPRLLRTDKPDSGNGWARLADAYAASGRMAEALDAARNAWASPDLGGD